MWTWLALAGALSLLPPLSGAARRMTNLGRRGRLADPAAAQPRAAAQAKEHLRAIVRRRSRAVARRGALAAATRLLVAELEAGSTPAEAFHAAASATTGDDSRLFVEAARRAASGESAGRVLAEGDDLIRPLGVAWTIAEQAGVPPAVVLARVGDDLTAGIAQHQAVTTALAGPRSSAFLLAALPAFGLFLGSAMGAAPLRFLLTMRAGHVVGAVGLALDLTGIYWTQRLIDRAMQT